MSRYQKEISEEGILLVWGFDNPMSEYFLQAFRMDALPDEDDVIFSISSYHTLTPHPEYEDRETWSNAEMLELIEKDYGDHVPAAHKNAMAVDSPF